MTSKDFGCLLHLSCARFVNEYAPIGSRGICCFPEKKANDGDVNTLILASHRKARNFFVEIHG